MRENGWGVARAAGQVSSSPFGGAAHHPRPGGYSVQNWLALIFLIPALACVCVVPILTVLASLILTPSSLAGVKDFIQIIESCVTIAAVIVGGLWGYNLFVRYRQRFPRAILSHSISHFPLGRGRSLLHVQVTISNAGQVLLNIVSVTTRVQRVLPIPSTISDALESEPGPVPPGESEVPWPLVSELDSQFMPGQFEVEPGEHDEIHYDFFIPDDLKVLEVYTSVANQAKPGRDLSWNITTIHQVPTDSTRRDKARRKRI
jgi:hypothetical protein